MLSTGPLGVGIETNNQSAHANRVYVNGPVLCYSPFMLRQIGFYLLLTLFLVAVVLFALWIGELSAISGLNDE